MNPSLRIWNFGLAAAVATGLAGCTQNAADPNGTGIRANDGPRADRDVAMTVTGCLQQGSGLHSYILSQANVASDAVGTSGSDASRDRTAADTGKTAAADRNAAAPQDKIGHEQEAAAERSYRLDGDNDQLKNLVGKEVRVSGKLADPGDINTPSNRDERGTSGSADRDISASDIAKIDVASIESIPIAARTAARDPATPARRATLPGRATTAAASSRYSIIVRSATVAPDTRAAVVQPSTFRIRPFTRLPITRGSLASSIIMMSSGGVEKP